MMSSVGAPLPEAVETPGAEGVHGGAWGERLRFG